MKNIIIKITAISALCALVVGVAGCSKPGTEKDALKSDEQGYVVYCNVDSAEFFDNESTNAGVNVDQKNINIFKPGYDVRRSTYQSENPVLEKSVRIDGQELGLKYHHSISQNIVSSKNADISALGRYDAYEYFASSSDKSTADVYLGKKNGNVMFYLDYEINRNSEGITEQEARSKADETAVSLYGEDVFSKFTHEKTTDCGKQGWIVTYVRYINGYETDETIRIVINGEGKLCSINALSLGVFDYIDVTKEQIENAEKALSERLPENCHIGDKYLTVDSNGECYLYYCVTMGTLSLYEYYINVI